MKKKILAVALSMLMVCAMTVALYACGGGNTNAYTVTYATSDLGETGTLPTDENEYKEGDEVTLKPASFLELTNYHFIGWNDGTKTYKVSEKYTMPAKNVTLTAVWQLNGYTVSFSNSRADSSDAIVLEDQYQAGAEITLIEKPASFTDENGRTFSGWYTVQNENTVYYDVGDTVTMPAQNVVFYAYWQASSIKATFYLEQGIGGAEYATKTYEIGETMTIEFPDVPADKTVDGKVYEFDGWYRNDNEDIELTINTVFSEQDKEYGAISLFAKWKEKGGGEQTYTVTYYSAHMQGVVLSNAEYKAGETVTVLGKPASLEGDTEFLGWYNSAGIEYSVGSTFAMPEANVNLFPLWKESDTIPVYFFIDGDATWFAPDQEPWLTVIQVEPDGIGNMTTPDINSFELGQYATGYEFAGWYYYGEGENGELGDLPFDENYIFNEDDLDWTTGGLYVYAVWTPVTAE